MTAFDAHKKTRFAIFATNILNEPFAQLYFYVPFILQKELHATTFQIALLVTLKPLVSLFSFYWSSNLKGKKEHLRRNLLGAGILERLPFLFMPFIHSVWFLVIAASIRMLFYRAGTPAWMEILKRNLPKEQREKLFSIGSALGYAEGVLIAIGCGLFLDANPDAWKVLFFASACLGLISVWLQWRLPIEGGEIEESKDESSGSNVHIAKPWKESLDLLRTRPDFAHFQWGFMACGFGLMLFQPAIPLFFSNELKLSYLDLTIALSICKGLGYVFSSPFWAKAMNRFKIYPLAGTVFFVTGLYPLFLFLSPRGHEWLYIASIMYGIAQGGSHLIWHMSGPLFSHSEESSQFTRVNLVMVGIRGLVAPWLGSYFCSLGGPMLVFLLSILLCFYGACKMMLPKQFSIPSTSS